MSSRPRKRIVGCTVTAPIKLDASHNQHPPTAYRADCLREPQATAWYLFNHNTLDAPIKFF